MNRASHKGIVAGRVVVASASQASPMAHAVSVIAAGKGSTLQIAPEVRPEARAPEPAPSIAMADVEPLREPLHAGQPDHGTQLSVDRAVDQVSIERRLERRIRAHMSKGELVVTLTDNRYTMISVRREGRGIKQFKVRLHQMFADASPTITRALARYIAYNDREASRILGDFIDANQHRVSGDSRKIVSPRLRTRGKIHDLQRIFEELNARYFGNSIDARITWGQKTGKPKRRNSIKMGSYSVEDRLIRIHRSLDRSFVPAFFVEWVVYHEMLHQVHDIKVVNGRRQFHSREFLRDEAKFERYVEARLWERAHLDALLTY